MVVSVSISLSPLKAQESPSEDFGCQKCDGDVMAAFLVDINAKKMGKWGTLPKIAS